MGTRACGWRSPNQQATDKTCSMPLLTDNGGEVSSKMAELDAERLPERT